MAVASNDIPHAISRDRTTRGSSSTRPSWDLSACGPRLRRASLWLTSNHFSTTKTTTIFEPASISLSFFLSTSLARGSRGSTIAVDRDVISSSQTRGSFFEIHATRPDESTRKNLENRLITLPKGGSIRLDLDEPCCLRQRILPWNTADRKED